MLVKHRDKEVEVTCHFRGQPFTQIAPKIPNALVGISNQIAAKFSDAHAQEFVNSHKQHL